MTIDYDKVGLQHYRILTTFKTDTGIIPPNEITTKFGHITDKGVLTIFRGFCWDGATGAYDTPSFMRGSCLHDWFCNAVDNKVLPVEYRAMGDDLLYKIIIEDGMQPLRAKYVHHAVLTYGKLKYHTD